MPLRKPLVFAVALLAVAGALCLGMSRAEALPPFSDIGAGLAGLSAGSLDWGDYDSDGDLDLLMTGRNLAGTRFALVYRNNGNGTFTDLDLGLPGVWESAAAWGDYDSDGKLDFLLTGWDASSSAMTKLYRGAGDGTFTQVTGTGLPAVKNGAVEWDDYDSDGKPDVLLTGSTVADGGVSGSVNAIYRNNGDGTFSDSGAGLAAMRGDSVAWGDYDSDGRPDIVETGASGSGPATKLYRNVGNGTFAENTSAGLANLSSGVAAWGDYDADGDLDLLLTGMDGVPARYAKVYKNNSNGTFASVADLGTQQGQEAAGGWGDYDADGDLDILLTSYGTIAGYHSTIYRNDGGDVFTDIVPGLTPGVANGGAAWGDYDSDGRLDVGLTGYYNDGPYITDWHRFAAIYHNDTATANTLPSAPTGLGYSASGAQVRLFWNPASDMETPANALTYNLRIGAAPGGLDLVSPLALASGKRLVPAMGNVGQRTGFTLLTSLPGGTYYWSVQTVDSELAGSAFAAERSFTVPQWFSLSAAACSAGEASGPAAVTIVRSGSTVGPAAVRFSATNGSAQAGSDFDAVDEVVGFASGEVQKTVSVPVRDDSIHEPSETVLLSLSSPSAGATLGDPNAATLTISDDENGMIASARLTKKSFKAAKAAKVKLLYTVDPSSKLVAYRLSRRSGSKWVTVRSVTKVGSFAGSYALTAKQLFGPKRVKPGSYRLRLSAEANAKQLAFRVD
jgi:hypothetical protein